MPPVVKSFTSKCSIKKGDLVLVKEDNIPRLQWLLGLFVDIFPGQESVLRSVNVKTSRGVLNRAVQELHNLQVSRREYTNVNETAQDLPDIDAAVQESSDSRPLPETAAETHTRSGRSVKVPRKLDLFLQFMFKLTD